MRGDKVESLGTGLIEGVLTIDIVDQDLVNLRTGGLREGNKSSILELATPPEIDRGRVSMVPNVHVVTRIDRREFRVVAGGRGKTGANGEKRNAESPDVLKGRFEREERVRANEREIRKSSPIEGDDCLGNSSLDSLPDLSGKNKEKGMIREERDDENINEKDPRRER
jgi:hypothetical protein